MASCVRARVVRCTSSSRPPSSPLADVIIRRPRGAALEPPTLAEPLPLRRVPPKDLSSGNVYEAGGVQVQFRALLRGCGGPSSDVWAVAVQDSSGGTSKWRAAQMSSGSPRAPEGDSNIWSLEFTHSSNSQPWIIDLGLNCPFALASYDGHLPFGEDSRLDPAGPRSPANTFNPDRECDVAKEFPFWPQDVSEDLGRVEARGPATVVYHADTFLEMLHTSAFPTPVLFPHGAFKLDTRLGPVAAKLKELLHPKADGTCHDTANSHVAHSLLRAIEANAISKLSGGRLVGMMEDGLGQLGNDLLKGLLEATSERQAVKFPGPPMGIGLGPATLEEETGAMVTDVEPDSYADDLGVSEGWTLDRINGVDTRCLPFWDIDAMFDQPPPWEILFGTASQATNLYAVEIPAAELMLALLASESAAGRYTAADFSALVVGVEAGQELQESAGAPFLWQEPYSRLFLGDPGSMTCLHVDLLPQLEFCHMLIGTKVLGACSWEKTPQLLNQHAGVLGPGGSGKIDESEAEDCARYRPETTVPADQPLDDAQFGLLMDPDIGLVVARPGDIAAFSSAAAHFATNGSGGVTGAVYHGALSAAAVPRLCADACSDRDPFTASEREGEYSRHLTSTELVADLASSASASSLPQPREDPDADNRQLLELLPEAMAKLLASGCREDREAAAARLKECRAVMLASLNSIQRRDRPSKWKGESTRWHI